MTKFNADRRRTATAPPAAPGGWSDVLGRGGQQVLQRPEPGETFVLLDDARPGASSALFRRPQAIIAALELAEVRAALAALEAGVSSGLCAAGYLAYEAGFAFEPRLERLHRPEGAGPLLWFGLFDAPQIGCLLSDASQPPFMAKPPALERTRYEADVNAILDLIRAGDCYQINYTQEVSLNASLAGAATAFDRLTMLRGAQMAGWGGAIAHENGGIVSCSPELFFSVTGDEICTKPMKGTITRGMDSAQDRALMEMLRRSPKERAENLMIVDLLRNDLSRICAPGSVNVNSLFAVETYPTLHQMTSIVRGRLQPGMNAFDAIRRLFPCGSVTGAPKIRAMEIIAALEQRNRSAYTGAMGFIAPDGRAAFNVLIRSLEYETGIDALRFGVGSGIVADSVPEHEWNECAAKMRFLTG